MESTQRKLKPNPCEKANFLSKMFYIWIFPMLRKCHKKILEMNDLYQPMTSDKSTNLGDRLEVAWKKQLAKSTKPSLISAVQKTFWMECLMLTTLSFINDIVIRLIHPLLLGRLLLYFREDSNISYKDAMISASGIVLLNAVQTWCGNRFLKQSFHNGMKVRVAVCSVIYRKALRLSQTALGETAPGKVVNLLSNDVNRFDMVFMFMNSMWTAPLLAIIIGFLLWREFAWAGLIGIAIVFVVVPIQSYTGKLSSKFRLQTALRTDERIRFMDEIISGVQVIKMYAWEIPFAKLITFARKMELKIVRKTSYVRALFMTFMLFTTRMAIFCTMLSIALLYGSDQITAAKVFVMTSYYGSIAITMSQRFARGVAEISEANVAFRRLQNFLELEEKETVPIEKTENGFPSENGFIDKAEKDKILEFDKIKESKNISVSMRSATARWKLPKTRNPLQNGTKKNNEFHSEENDENELNATGAPTLDNLNVDLPRSKLIGIIGKVGAGKSSFLQVLLRELPIESGSIGNNGSISYASQEPWVFAGTVRQNILFGEEYDRERYDAVIKTCALIRDFEQLPNGDKTVIGERGTSLSGGQKARVNLARATYRRSDIYLLDDPLSAVDSHVGTHIFNKCIGPKGRLAHMKATRILVTHQVHFLKEADWLVVLQEGKIAAQGSPGDLSKSGIDFANLIGTDEKIDNPENQERMSRQSSVRSTSSLNSSNDGSIYDMNDDENKEHEGVQMESSSKGKFKGSVAVNYYKSGAHWSILAVIFILFLVVQFLASAADIWVSVWTKYEETHALHPNYNETNPQSESTFLPFELNTTFYVYVHGSLMALLFLTALSRSIGFYSMCVRASQKLHDKMFNGLISTKMRFFDTNPSGRVLNRFSKDIGAADEFLPGAIIDATQSILSMIGSVVVTAFVNPIFLIPVIVMGTIFIFIRKFFLKASKNIKRLEGNAKSPVYTHLAATLNGLSTIRAYDAENILKQEFDYHQDNHSSCWFMFISTSVALGLSLDIMVFFFTFSIIFFFMLFDTNVSGEKVGLAITQAMSLTGLLQWGVRQSAEISNQMMSVERILEYCDLEPETQPKQPRELSKDWPTHGIIEFRDVIYRYFDGAEPVLCGLSFVIKPKEKIGIVGRTGAGKSSLIGAIFRLACIEGEILIDDIDTSTIRLEDLRTRIAIIPQDPVLFSGTLRRNLDPFEEYGDADIWKALEEVELKDVASGPLGLNSAVMAHGNNFSVGQRQLICLARAILRKNRILVLDEATANVDPQTDLLIQQTIREKFAECTVLTVAHRLHTIIDSDRILVMDAGTVIEFDEAHVLLQNEAGIFSGMVKALGPQEYKRLSRTALVKYNAKYDDSVKIKRE